MKTKYAEISEKWVVLKALAYLDNFIRNHKGIVSDNDIFQTLTDMTPGKNWEELIRNTFPAATVKRMENIRDHRARLDFTDSPEEILREIWNSGFGRPRLQTLLAHEIGRLREQYPFEKHEGETFPRKFAELRQTFGLSDFESEVLLVTALIAKDLLTVIDDHCRRTDERDKMIFIAKCIDCDLQSVVAALDENGKLRRYGCVDSDVDFNRRLFEFLNEVSSEPLSSRFFNLCKDEVLPWDFYGQLAEKHGETIKRIIRNSDRAGATNILLYGEPGTGKTSFAKSLAAQLGLRCYCVVQNTGMNGEGAATSTPRHRFAALQLCDAQVDPAHSLIIVDEADDMLSDGMSGFMGLFFLASGSGKGDKGILNSVLDKLRTPTIWISNTPAGRLDPSSRRRFDYSIRFDPLTAVQRAAIWRNNVEKLELSPLIGPELIDRFAERYAVSAGIIAKVLNNVRKLAPVPEEVCDTVEKLMTQHCELLQISTANEKLLPARDYSLEGLNISGDIPLEKIVAAVRNFQNGSAASAPDRPRMNLLLSGPPGTGKTEFVKYLGQVLNTRITVKMGSDLLGMYVGQTEENIRNAFVEAEAQKSILFFDEIDGLVQSRGRADHSWEVTQVNELLHRMENFDGIMIGATNFSNNLDPAIMRRFTFKIGFNYLTDAGKKLFFERMFGTALMPEEETRLAKIPNLAPGDFRTVRQSFFYLGDEVTNSERLNALERESTVKDPGHSERHKMGFGS